MSEVRHSLVSQLPQQSRGEVGGKLESTYSRWTVQTTKATEGNAFCAHGRYFTKLQAERRAQFKWELGESQLQLYFLETVLFLQCSHKTQNYTSDTEIQLGSTSTVEVNVEIKQFAVGEQPVERVCSRPGWMNETVSVKQGEHISL